MNPLQQNNNNKHIGATAGQSYFALAGLYNSKLFFSSHWKAILTEIALIYICCCTPLEA